MMENMLKREVSLIDRFKKLEADIIAILKENEVDFDESLNEKEVKAKLKKYLSLYISKSRFLRKRTPSKAKIQNIFTTTPFT